MSTEEPGQFEVPDAGLAAIRGEEVASWSRNEVPKVRWHPNDLDRCEHGRHSIDHCADCPGGNQGNIFLMTEIPPNNAFPENVRYENGRSEVRIGTMYSGEPIWVVVRDAPRADSAN